MISEKRRRNYPSFFDLMACTREHTLYRNTNKIKFIFIMWLQYYAHSDWAVLSFNDQALLARCPRHIPVQSVFNLMVDILKDTFVMVN